MRRRDVPLALLGATAAAACSSSAASQEVTLGSGPNYPQSPEEVAANVIPINYYYPPGRPERYVAPGAAYSNKEGSTGSDFTQALQTALNIPNQPVLIGPFYYLFSNLIIQPAQQMIGYGIHHSVLVAKPGSSGAMVTDAGGVHGAAHLDLRGIAFYGNNCAYSAGLRLGYTTEPFGTEGVLDQIWVRDLPAGFPGIDIRGNVGEFGFLISQNTGGLQLIGTALTATQLECVGCKGFLVNDVLTVCNFGDSQVGALEIEAQANGTTSIYLTGNTSVSMLTISLSEAFSSDHLVEIGPSATTWAIHNFKLYFKDPPPLLAGGNFKAGGEYFGGNASGGSHSGEGNYLSGLATHGNQFGFKSQQLSSFTLRLQNSAGTVEHLIGAVGTPNMATNLASTIASATNVPTSTPVGTNSFANGVTIPSSNLDVIVLDSGLSGAWQAGDAAFMANIAYNTTGTAYTVIAFVAEATLGGINRSRLHLSLRDAAKGNPVSWIAALADPGRVLDITIMGFLR